MSTVVLCAKCSTEFVWTKPHNKRGGNRPSKYCSETCRRKVNQERVERWRERRSQLAVLTCADCGESKSAREFPGVAGKSVYCKPCSNRRSKRSTCVSCGSPCVRSAARGVVHPVGNRCQQCRRKYPEELSRCGCGKPKGPLATRCRDCHFVNLSASARSHPRSVWISPPGANLGTSAWRRLRAEVLAEEPLCRIGIPGICTVVSDEVDHIVPRSVDPTLTMARSNLRGACRACNSSLGNGGVKGLHLRILPQCLAFHVAEPEPPAPRPNCPVCDGPVEGHGSRKYCTDECRAEANARQVRDQYRAKRGLPVDPAKPTKSFGRRRLWQDVDQLRKIPVSAAG